MKLTDPMDRDTVPCYWLGKTQFVPHYTEEQIFVAPGGLERTEKWLLDRGAVKSTSHLWPRRWLTKLLTERTV